MKRNLCISLIILALTILFLAQQTNTLKTTNYTWQSDRVPEAFDGFRIAQLSDLHNKRFGKGQKRLVEAIQAARPDMIAFTGDLVDDATKNLDFVREFLDGVKNLAPIYYVDGNHDENSPHYDAFLALLSQYNVMVLNGYARLERGGDAMTLAGFPFWPVRYKQLDTSVPADIVLLHDPFEFENFAKNGYGLMLAGHIHGGQIALPGGRAIYMPSAGLFPKYSAGLYRHGEAAMIVSRGLGTVGVPFRAFSLPEIVIIELKCE